MVLSNHLAHGRRIIEKGHTLSAYLVNKDTIDLLVSAALEPRWLDPHSSGFTIYAHIGEIRTDTDELAQRVAVDTYAKDHHTVTLRNGDGDLLGRELYAANYRSLMSRYPRDFNEEGLAELLASYRYAPVWKDDATLSQLLGALHCFRYQSCERSDERLGFWGYFCNWLERAAVSTMCQSWEYVRPVRTVPIVSIFEMAKAAKNA